MPLCLERYPDAYGSKTGSRTLFRRVFTQISQNE